MSLNDDYRIRRTNKLNMVIERQVAESKIEPTPWVVVSYHGNSAKSLLYGLLQVAMGKYTPRDVKLSEQVEKVQLELVCIEAKLTELIENALL